MERRAMKSFLVLSCLLVLPFVSSVAMPRNLRLGSQQQQHPPALNLPSSQEAAPMDLGGRPEARMDVEVNDYRPPGANNGHDPGHGHGHGH